MPKKFGEPIDVRFADDTSRQFTTTEQLKEWAEQEALHGEDFAEAMASVSLPAKGDTASYVTQLRNIINLADQHIGASDTEADQHRNNMFANLRKLAGRYIRFESPRGKYLLALAQEDPNLAWGVMAAWSPVFVNFSQVAQNAIPNQVDWSLAFELLIRGGAAAQNFDAGLDKKAVAATRASLTRLQQRWTSELDTRIETLEQNLKDYALEKETINNELDEWRERAKKRWRIARAMSKKLFRYNEDRLDKFKEFYGTELLTRKPVSFWRDKGQFHRNQSFVWGLVFFVSVAFSILGFFWWTREYMPPQLTWNEIISDTANGNAIKPTVGALTSLTYLIIPAFLVLWALKFMSRQLHVHISLWQDALERVVLAQTFISLVDQGQADAKERILVLHALFRPSGGAGAEDSAPPHWFDIVLDRMGLKKDIK